MIPDSRKSITFTSPLNLKLDYNTLPRVSDGGLIIKVMSCAICGSDLRIYREGNARITTPQTIGHEISGTVVAKGATVTQFSIGDNVSIGADIPCGECSFCLTDRPNCCDINYAIGYQFEGGYSEYLVLNDLTVKYGPIAKFSNAISFDEAALAEPLACCINGFERAHVESGNTFAIFGAGPIGTLLALLAKTYDAKKIFVIEPNATRRQKICTLTGAIPINPNEEIKTQILSLTSGLGVDRVFTACPSIDAHKTAFDIITKRGMINFFGGLGKNSPPLSIYSNDIHYKEIYVTGSHGSTPQQHKKALALIEDGTISVKELITHNFTLDEYQSAFDTALSGQALKVMVNPHA